jgi:hypothetical protein
MKVGDLVIRKWPKPDVNDTPVGVIIEEKHDITWSHDLDATTKYFLIKWSNRNGELLLSPNLELEVINES